jgi:hypothetical protein
MWRTCGGAGLPAFACEYRFQSEVMNSGVVGVVRDAPRVERMADARCTALPDASLSTHLFS